MMVSCLIFFFFSMSLNWFFALFVVLGKNPPSPRVELVIRICAWAILELSLLFGSQSMLQHTSPTHNMLQVSLFLIFFFQVRNFMQ
jgi:hypothetical protein